MVAHGPSHFFPPHHAFEGSAITGRLSEDVIELLIYHQPSVKPSLTLRPFGVLGYVAGHSLTEVLLRFRNHVACRLDRRLRSSPPS